MDTAAILADLKELTLALAAGKITRRKFSGHTGGRLIDLRDRIAEEFGRDVGDMAAFAQGGA